MKKLNLILIIALFFIAFAFIAYAGFPYDTVIDGVAYTGNDTAEDVGATGNWSNGLNTGVCSSINGMLSTDGAVDAACAWKHQGIQVATNTINYTIFHGNISVNSCPDDGDFVMATSRINFTDDTGTSVQIRRIDAVDPTLLALNDAQVGGGVAIGGWARDGTTQDVQFVVSSTNFYVIINGTTRATVAYSAGFEPDFISFGSRGATANVCSENISSFVSYNGSIYNRSIIASDTTKPIGNTSFNISSPKINDVINFTANVTDETALLHANWTINFTSRLFFNYSFPALTTKAEVSNSTKITCGRGCVLNFTLDVTDTSGNTWQNSTLFTIADTLGTLDIGLNISTIRIRDAVNVSANITEPDGDLAYCMIAHNQSGSMVNTSFLNANCSQSIGITLGRGNVVNFTTFYNDTSGNLFTNSTKITIADTLGTIRIGFNMTSIRINDVLNISGNITEPDGNIAHGWVVDNRTGTNINYSFTGSGSNFNFSQAITINVSRGNVINFSVFYNDTYNTLVQNSTLLTITNTNPTAPNIFNASNAHYNLNSTLNVTPSSDADSDILTYFWYYNTTAGNYVFAQSGTSLTSWTTNLTDGAYGILVNVSDGVINISSSFFNFTIDNSIPTFTNNNLTNNTFNNKNITPFFTCNDPDIFNSTGNLSNSTHTFQFKYNDTPFSDGTKLNMILALNLTGLKDGNYTYTESCSDTHSEPIDQTKTSKGKKGEAELIFNDTQLSKEINFKVFFREKLNKLTDTPATLKSYADYLPNGFLGFGVNVTIIKPETKIAFIISTNQGIIQIINSSYESHLRSSPYGMDFNATFFVNDIEESFTTTTTRINEMQVEVLIIPTTPLAGGDVVVFQSKTLFGLNEPKQDFNIVVDNTLPAFSSRTPLNDSALTSANVQLNISINETYSQNFSLSANFSGIYSINLSGGYDSGSVIIYNVTLADGFYVYSITANDTAGNENTTQNFTFTLDSTPPVITLNTPSNNTVITDTEKPNVNFRISANEDVKNCSLFLSNSLVGNESTQKQSHNFTVNSISAGNHKWNATCYDSADNLGASKIFNLEINLISGGASSAPESAGGGGIGTPPPIEENEEEIIEKGYTMTYICQKAGKFINDTPSYNLNDIVLLQEDIRWEIGVIIPFTTLSSYVDDYDNFCGKKKLPPAQNNSQNISVIETLSNIGNRFSKISGLNIGSYFRLPFKIDFGKLKDTDSNARGFFDFINVFMPLSVSDGLSDTPNVVWEGGVRIIPLAVIGIVLLAVVIYKRYAKSRKSLDFLANPENIKQKNK